MNSKLELYKAYGSSQYGFEPIFIGVNAARIGIPLSKVVNGFSEWVGSGYDEAFFESLIIGYNNAFNDEYLAGYEKVVHGSLDTNFILANVIKSKSMVDFTLTDSGNKIDINRGIGEKSFIAINHDKYNISFKISYYRSISWDSGESVWWNIRFDIKHNVDRLAFNIDYRKTIDIGDDRWCGGVNCRGCSEVSGWYEQCDKNGKRHTIAHSSSVAKLIDVMTNDFIKVYNLNPKSTIGEIARRK